MAETTVRDRVKLAMELVAGDEFLATFGNCTMLVTVRGTRMFDDPVEGMQVEISALIGRPGHRMPFKMTVDAIRDFGVV